MKIINDIVYPLKPPQFKFGIKAIFGFHDLTVDDIFMLKYYSDALKVEMDITWDESEKLMLKTEIDNVNNFLIRNL